MSGTGDTGQELPGKLSEKDEKSDTDNNVLAKKDGDLKQDIQKDACEALEASKNESVEDKELSVSDFSEQQDTFNKSVEKFEEISSNNASEKGLAEELESPTDADTKLQLVEYVQERTATNAVEINESSSSAEVKEEVKAGLEEKHEHVSVPAVDVKSEAEADERKHETSGSQGDVNQELTSAAKKELEPSVTAEAYTKEDLTSAEKKELEPTVTAEAEKEEDLTSQEKEELEPTAAAEEERGEDLTSAEKKGFGPTTTAETDKEEDLKSAEKKELEPVTNAQADKEEDITSAEKKELESNATADETAAYKEAESSLTAEAHVNQESSLVAATKEELAVTKEKKPDSPEDADEKSKSVSVSYESSATSAVQDEKPKGEEDFLDILGNGTLLKKVLEKGHGSRPNMGDEIIIQVSQEIPELGKSFPEEQLQYVLGDGDVVQALDLAVALMDVGEKAVVISGYKYMYGDLGLEPDIPPLSNFKLTVKLVASNGPLDFPTMDFNTRFAEAKKKKDRGNFLFKRKEFALALNSYTKASRILDPALGCVFNDESAENLQKLLEFRAIVLCNTSAAQFKLEAYDAAVKSATEATRLSPTYHKAHVRLGQAYEKLGNTDQTIRSYKLALKNDTENSKWIHGELERLTKLNKKSKQTQQEMYSKMFWGANPPTVNGKPVKAEEVASFLVNQGPSTSSAPDIDAEMVWQYVQWTIMWHLGSVLGDKVRIGEMEEEEIIRVAHDFTNRFNNGGVPLTSAQLSAISKDLAQYVPADVCQLIEERCKYLDNQNAVLKSIGSPSDDLKNAVPKSIESTSDDVKNAVPKSIGSPSDDVNNAVPKIIGSPSDDVKNAEPKSIESASDALYKMPDLTAAEKRKPVSVLVEKPVSRHQPHSGIMYYEGTDVDTGFSTMSATPPNYVLQMRALESEAKQVPKKKEEQKKTEPKKSSWMWKTGATLAGAGLVGLAGIGIYKYMNH